MAVLRRFLRLVTIVVVVSGVVFLIAGAIPLWYLFRTIDYSHVPKQQMFQSVWGQRIPRGVADIRIAGEGFGQSGIVFMRVEVPLPVLKSLLAAAEPISRDDFPDGLRYGQPSWRAYQRTVGWSDISHASQLVYFSNGAPHGTGWSSVIAVDRVRGTLWVKADLL